MPIVEVTYPEDRLITALLCAERAPHTACDAANIPGKEALRLWILCHEVAEGSWRAGGQVIEFETLRAAAAAERKPGAHA